jgi:predicted MPP superfamily phosphohydrolase
LHHLNIPNDAIPYFSQTSSNFTTQIKIGESDTFTNLPETGKTRTPAQVVADIPDNATYANGMLTIQMALTQSLFYDYENNKFIVSYTGSSGLPEKNCIVLVSSYYGNIHGDWVDHAAYRNEFLKPSAYLGNGNGFSYTNRTNGTVDIYITTSISFVLSNGSTVSFNKEDIVAQLGSSAVIEGDAVKITLGTYKGLFYNAITGALFISSTGASGNGIIPLLFNAWTNLYGSFLQFYIRNKITEHDTQIDAIDKYIKLPSYYVDEINDTANKLSKLPGTNFNYLVLTDIHYSYPSEFTQTKLKQLMESVNQLGNGTNIDAVLFLGDIIEGGSTANRETSVNQINEMLGGLRNIRKPVLCLFGNHDNNMYDFSYSSAEPYRNTDHYITMGEWKNKAVYPFGIDNDYYCVDFPKKNMRVIVTNTCDYQESVDSQGNVTIADYHEIMIRHNQLDAIAGMLLESAYDSVVFAHGLPTALFQLISEYNTRGSWTKENGEVVSFANVTHKVVLYHTGHYHNNAIEYNSGYNVNIISTSCTCMAHVQQTLYSRPPTNIVTSWEDISDNYPILYNERVIPRISNTINETCMDIVSIGNGKINKIGFGAAFDGTLNIV